MTAPQPTHQRPKLFGWKAIFIMIVLLNYSAMFFVFLHSSNNAESLGEQLSHLQPPPPPPFQKSSSDTGTTTAADKKQHLRNNDHNHQSNINHPHNNPITPPPSPQILLAGMAFSDNTISDYALSFLLHAACSYNIHSHILLAKRDSNTPLTKKIEVLAAHSQPLPLRGKQVRPKCRKLITVEVAPGEDVLLNMTKSYHNHHQNNNNSSSSNRSMMMLMEEEEETPNNPWNEHNRIARIKRSREYQRQLVIQMLTNNNNNNKVDWTKSQDAVIGVLDLDLFDYPSPMELINSARDYIMMTRSDATNNHDNDRHNNTNDHNNNDNTKYHAICSNGLFVMKSRSYNGYRRRYYDTFSTILLPNSWLHVDREKVRGTLDGEDVGMASMNQDETLQWILMEGRRLQQQRQQQQQLSLSLDSNNNSDKEEEEEVQQYQPVPVRSCFNGLTLYRADVWLEPKCRYDSYHKDDDAYLSKRYQHACEHIVFHECLRRVLLEKEGGGSSSSSGEGLNIAVQPDMTTLWHHLS
eukprot:scaffold5819_cov148-Skeletonema_menzelii.AAC.5